MGEGSDRAGAKACGKERGEHAYIDLREIQFQNQPFDQTPVGKAEKTAIDRRRGVIKANGGRDRAKAPVTGLALSGGGVRSAAFNLGALQALEAFSGMDGVDYLSTVSGGGYIGCSLTAALSAPEAKKPGADENASPPEAPAEKPAPFPFISEDPKQFDDTPAVRHIRDYSNYLMPRGASDLVVSLGVILRGLLANIIIVAPFLFLGAGLTLLIYPCADSFKELAYFPPLNNWLAGEPLKCARGFLFTPTLALLNIAFLIVWAVWSRFRGGALFRSDAAEGPRSKGVFVWISQTLFVITAIGVAFDIQMLLLQFATPPSPRADGGAPAAPSGWLAAIVAFFKNVSLYLAPLGAVLAFFSKYFAEVAASAARSPTWMALFKRLGAKAALWLAALIIPVLLGVLYLTLIWHGLAQPEDKLRPFAWPPGTSLAALYLAAFCLTAGLALLIDPNITSLHRLYRERLSKAFLFNPDRSYLFDASGARLPDRDLQAFRPKLSKIETGRCPYPIVNASLNLVGSRFANRRGRNADFFVFTPEYIGSDATGYVGSTTIEARKKIVGEGTTPTGFDLGAAMAISGAAISPNMGTATVRPLVFTLAFLNIRLGYWLKNPASFAPPSETPGLKDEFKDLWEQLMDVAPIRLIREMFSQIDETSRTIYLTDGGNLENLGLHELLRRRCKVIIVFDSEEDSTMSFPSLLRLERYARIDFGAIIDLPWETVAKQCRAVSAAFKDAKDNGAPVPNAAGPHCAVGDVHYGGNADDDGLIVYFKSSLSGDEEDYILDYKRRYPAFPHESTGDQFFSEEQFEAYRALGFHIVKGFFTKGAPFAVCPKEDETIDAARDRVRAQVLAALKSPAAEADAIRTD